MGRNGVSGPRGISSNGVRREYTVFSSNGVRREYAVVSARYSRFAHRRVPSRPALILRWKRHRWGQVEVPAAVAAAAAAAATSPTATAPSYFEVEYS